jgi:hypothetical protein
MAGAAGATMPAIGIGPRGQAYRHRRGGRFTCPVFRSVVVFLRRGWWRCARAWPLLTRTEMARRRGTIRPRMGEISCGGSGGNGKGDCCRPQPRVVSFYLISDDFSSILGVRDRRGGFGAAARFRCR